MGATKRHANTGKGIFFVGYALFLLFLVLSNTVAGQTFTRNSIQTGDFPTGNVRNLEFQQVNIYGDSNPDNGIEDNRIDMSSPNWNQQGRHLWNMGAGTIHCDGKNRGSAVILDTREYGLLNSGFVIATSAHVLFDLVGNTFFKQCFFHYMAMNNLPGYQVEIDFQRIRMGDFNPKKPINETEFGQNDWAFLYIKQDIPGVKHIRRIRMAEFDATKPGSPDQRIYQFIAYNKSTDSISISTKCQVLESNNLDLGGGQWAGQLLDDCDSEDGASGGGIILKVENEYLLVGIRSGSHWNSDKFPLALFPEGPPGGSNWDTSENTNFGRAVDRELLGQLRVLVQEVIASHQNFIQL